jgi:hypothetical protein
VETFKIGFLEVPLNQISDWFLPTQEGEDPFLFIYIFRKYPAYSTCFWVYS